MTNTLFDTLVAGGLDHRTPTYRALGYRFAVQCDDAALSAHLSQLFEPFRNAGVPDTVYTFGAIQGRGDKTYMLYADDELVHTHSRAAPVLATLFWHVNRQVIAYSQDRFLIHASAVAHGGAALLFPASMESGKSTLAAGLVRAGFDYLTDETVAIRLDTGLVEPFPRALSIDRGSWDVLADLRPVVPTDAERYVGDQWQVRPSSIRPHPIAGPSTPRFVISPAYRDGSPTRLRPLGRADAVRLLAENSFNFTILGRSALKAAASLVRGADCYLFDIGDLETACRLITDLMSQHVSQPRLGTRRRSQEVDSHDG